jgi:copper oxidase (laccase) domain-containing protein
MLVERTIFSNGSFEIYAELPPLDLVRVKQTHSAIIRNTQEIFHARELLEGDGISFDYQYEKNVCIVTADCLPILMLHDHGGFLIHAGWRGLHKKIHRHPNVLEHNVHTIHVGPYIHGGSYAVGVEFVDYFGQGPWLTSIEGQWYFDQAVWLHHDCLNYFPRAKMTTSQLNTFSDLPLHSFRREKQSCRNYNVWRPK